jgi:hypothetical protein
MDHSAFALPILPGKTVAARAFHEELEGRRKGEYARSQRARGIVRELWFLQETPNGDLFVAYLEGPDLNQALDRIAASREAFDIWFKQQLAFVTGIDLNNSLSGPPSRLVSRYEAPA